MRKNGRLKLVVPGRGDRHSHSGLLLRSDLHSVPCPEGGGEQGGSKKVDKQGNSATGTSEEGEMTLKNKEEEKPVCSTRAEGRGIIRCSTPTTRSLE